MASLGHIESAPLALASLYQATISAVTGGIEASVQLSLERLMASPADLTVLTGLVTDRAANQAASRLSEAISRERGRRSENVFYVVANDERGVSKFGITFDPLKRLRSLQVGSIDQLRIHALIWSMSYDAGKLERACLSAADEMGARLSGEWTSLAPDAATALALKAACGLSLPLADSAMWLRNRQRMAEARRSHQRALGDAAPECGLGYRGSAIGTSFALRHST